MIIRCPSCSTRFDLPASKFGTDGTMMKCSVCGHDWIEARAVEISRDQPIQLPAVIEPVYEPDQEIRRLVDATRQAEEAFALKRKRRRTALAAWSALALVLGSPGVYALSFPESTVRLVPASITLYDWMGKRINVYGLDLRKIEMEHLLTEGQRVIAIKGEILNVSGGARKIPWLRFGLKDPSGKEIYSWQLETNIRPLNAGESTAFVTRIAAPPEGAQDVEIRFARADEIGSNTQHE